MMRITFHEKNVRRAEKSAACGQESIYAGCDGSGKIRYLLNDGSLYENRSCVLKDGVFQFDGYSTWFEEAGENRRPQGDFTLSLFLAPQEYSDEGDGLWCCLDRAERKGFGVLLHKHGRVAVCFGSGKELFSFSSIRCHAVKYAWNLITVIFRKEAGWCDLYINGTLSNRKQFPRHMALEWPRRKALLGKSSEGSGTPDAFGVFCGLMREAVLADGCLSDSEARAQALRYDCGKDTGPLVLDRASYREDAQRPQFHLIPPGKWMNEPHAPLWYEGNYHIFYQANPHAPSWNHIQWGHMISPDMIRWKDRRKEIWQQRFIQDMDLEE